MPLYNLGTFRPNIEEGVFIAPSADIIGRVHMKENSNIWFNCVARGDINEIIIGKNTNIQDLSMLHVDTDLPLIVGDNVTVGHCVTLHACTVGDNCLIGMGATILNGAVIGESSLVAAGSVVPPGKVYPPRSFIIGSPAIAKRELSDDEVKKYGEHYKRYIIAKDQFLKDLHQ